MEKINLGVIFGGKSAEHEISIRSAISIIEALDRNKYNIILISIDKNGRWYLKQEQQFLSEFKALKAVENRDISPEIHITKQNDLINTVDKNTNQILNHLDVVFPILHGTFGEDGTIQGMLKALDIPFVGVDILASSVGMDKDVAKRLWRDAGIPVADFICVHKKELAKLKFNEVKDKLGLPIFVKPANAGSSVGVHKVHNLLEFDSAVSDAFQYDKKILIEEAIKGREVECAILGNEYPKASLIGEIVSQVEFYSYEAKYIDADGARLIIPASITKEEEQTIQEAAIKAFQAIECEGLARVDFFLKPDGTIVINEINTMPGFTSISMYPKLWEASGIPYFELLDHLIELAILRHQRDTKLKTSF
ncbi:MAG: D-alanine--D-alanine ligase [Saprospiraceae bacterium]|nr:D-alanine--D-alanine ligase [Candidatus Vicinibacter affinis]MBP6171942.1 D-alanine--D-alanine ligase [Saprospiraceae bacterium]MBK6573110.1 D-alanine--D-alanine ligase [Candidatus Vicinibacter affinis]MBK7301791.1 D-alanine--D-alanine ligase [Candidatus Vicinibacter affinis]MBK7692929.1 D-alanine--D-alanine ligase [Candidatus Vicinibacter affinis]